MTTIKLQQIQPSAAKLTRREHDTKTGRILESMLTIYFAVIGITCAVGGLYVFCRVAAVAFGVTWGNQ